MSQIITVPYTILVDTREQRPYTFEGMHADADAKYTPLAVPTARATLKTGDYAILGLESAIAIERKSVADLVGTVLGGRERWEAELERMQDYHASAVVVEGQIGDVALYVREGTKGKIKSVSRSMLAWSIRFPGTHWWFLPNRRAAEVWTFRLLDRVYQESLKESCSWARS